MAATIKVLVPEATINYVQNPSFRYATTGWTAVGSAITRVLTYLLYGISSLMVVTNGLASREGVYYRVNSLVGISEPITISAYVRGEGTVQLRLIEGLGKEWISEPATMYPDRWTRMEVTGFTTGSNDVRLYVETVDGKTPREITFYVDGAQMERKSYATTYADGDQPGCRWNIMDSSSNSSRDENTRQGGRWVELAGPCRQDDIYITLLGGMGMPPLQNNIQSWALAPGSYFQNTKILDRTVNITFHVKNRSLRIVRSPDSSPLHKLRQQLIDIFKPDLTGGGEPFIFSYQEGERELFLNMRYESGLEGSWDIRNQWVDALPLRFLSVDPFFYENNYHAQALNFKDDDLFMSSAGRIDGQWKSLSGGLGGGVGHISIGKYGEPIYAGTFTKNGLETITLNRIGYFDGTDWKKIGMGLGNSGGVTVAPNGDVYAYGLFTEVYESDGTPVAANRIARWDGTHWYALGAGLDGNVLYANIAPNGDVYVVGAFHNAGGIAAAHVARWDGLAWRSMGALAGLNDDGYSIAISKDGTSIYISGKFTDQFSLAASALLRVTKYNPATNLFSAVGSGFNANANDIVFSPNGVLYAVGTFTASGSTTLSYIAKWTGSNWVSVGNGMTGTNVLSLDINDKEQIIAVGQFTKADNVSVLGIAFWNGSNWTNTDIQPGTTLNAGGALLAARFSGEDIYLGGQAWGRLIAEKSLFAAINTVINNGTAEVNPIIYIYGPGRLRWMENQTTKKRIYMDLTILDNEEVFIDFGKKTVTSAIRGDLTYSIIPGSDFDDFSLVPGNNKLAVFMTDDVNSLMYIFYRPTHWSIDATVNAEALP